MTTLDELNISIAPTPRPDAEAIEVQRRWQATGEVPRAYVAEAIDGSFSTADSLRTTIERSVRDSTSAPNSNK